MALQKTDSLEDQMIGGRWWPLGEVAVRYIAGCLALSLHDATLVLQTAMLDGRIKSRGPLRGRSAELLPTEFWRFTFPDVGATSFNLMTLERLHWFEVCAVDVLMIWPDTASMNGASCTGNGTGTGLPPQAAEPQKRTPGPKPARLVSTVSRMMENLKSGATTPETLRDEKQESLAKEYGVSRETVRKARDAALSQLSELSVT